MTKYKISPSRWKQKRQQKRKEVVDRIATSFVLLVTTIIYFYVTN